MEKTNYPFYTEKTNLYKMPRAKKQKAAEIEFPPVIFFLKLGKNFKEEQPIQVPVVNNPGTVYSDILKEMEMPKNSYDESIIHELMSKIHLQTEYPQGTCCFWCCHAFDWTSFIIPTHYDFYNNFYTAEGNFCSPECALSYIYAEPKLTNSQKWHRHCLLRSLYSKLYTARDLMNAPDRRTLRMFGGSLDIKQFREYVWNGTKPLQLELPPIRLYVPSVNTQTTNRDIKSYVALSTEAVDKASQQLRLKRSKPVHSNSKTFDSLAV
ncbi:hypothetical protein EB118_10905 [bacterium]|nr:hypothetical protein [Actinomycetota bacterium]NDG30564.1 hypothetical protein [bacterium]